MFLRCFDAVIRRFPVVEVLLALLRPWSHLVLYQQTIRVVEIV
jgi:hypothetical protein